MSILTSRPTGPCYRSKPALAMGRANLDGYAPRNDTVAFPPGKIQSRLGVGSGGVPRP